MRVTCFHLQVSLGRVTFSTSVPHEGPDHTQQLNERLLDRLLTAEVWTNCTSNRWIRAIIGLAVNASQASEWIVIKKWDRLKLDKASSVNLSNQAFLVWYCSRLSQYAKKTSARVVFEWPQWKSLHTLWLKICGQQALRDLNTHGTWLWSHVCTLLLHRRPSAPFASFLWKLNEFAGKHMWHTTLDKIMLAAHKAWNKNK